MSFIPFLAIPLIYGYLIKPNNKRSSQFKPFMNRPYAHRGYHSKTRMIPENSMRAFKRAVKHDLGIELDVQITSDGKCVIMHDYNLNRASGYPHDVDETNSKIIKGLTLFGTQDTIPTLQEVLDAVRGKVPLIVEIKQKGSNCAVCAQCAKLLDLYPGAFMVESFNPIAVNWFKKNRPHYLRGQLGMNLKNDKNIPLLLKKPLEYLCFNALSKPDFIAYDIKNRQNISFKIIHKIYHSNTVLWTVRQKDSYDELKDEYDILIFERFNPLIEDK